MIDVGPFEIHGDWDAAPTSLGKLRIVMPPLGAVFGAGWHAHTQAALLSLVEHAPQTPNWSFADIGTGSGILSVAAKLLGAGKVYATELSPDALNAARRTFAANGIDVELIDATWPPGMVDLCVCSISGQFVRDNAEQLRGVARRVLVVLDDASVEVH